MNESLLHNEFVFIHLNDDSSVCCNKVTEKKECRPMMITTTITEERNQRIKPNNE